MSVENPPTNPNDPNNPNPNPSNPSEPCVKRVPVPDTPVAIPDEEPEVVTE
jgi:hypothetical protein